MSSNLLHNSTGAKVVLWFARAVKGAVGKHEKVWLAGSNTTACFWLNIANTSDEGLLSSWNHISSQRGSSSVVACNRKQMLLVLRSASQTIPPSAGAGKKNSGSQRMFKIVVGAVATRWLFPSAGFMQVKLWQGLFTNCAGADSGKTFVKWSFGFKCF
ncbi:hypothetical protein VNO80_03877 [Phaseolus coccineus]|uniref:Uncharacterized protein n=1 Tax=Phaseolus coccineus TaxID=3886 RepID=A0AAN9NSL3_PHACN